MTPTEYADALPIAAIESMRIATPNHQCAWRVETFWDKEPDTLAWIAGFNEGAVFVDVGANIGLYSVWAAITRQARVWAFEPEALNFAELNRNIALNRVPVAAYPIALSDESQVSSLFLSGTQAGGSCHTFGQKLDSNLQKGSFKYRQGSVSARLDDLISDGLIPQPHHIKVDVDGLEHKVYAGGRQAMLNAKSVLIEINSGLPEHIAVVEAMEAAGFVTDPAQIAAARRTEGRFAGTGNVLFKRC